ncbi:unnamed protein product [Prunus brigantina]
MEHFFGQQWKAQGIYHLIKLFDQQIVMDQSLLAASSITNTMNLRFGMMTPTVLDMAALFGLSPLGVEVNAALVAPEAVGSFKAAWPTLTRLAGSKAKNMLNYSSFYNNFGEQGHPGVRPSGRLSCARWEARWPTLGFPVLAPGLLPRTEGCNHGPPRNTTQRPTGSQYPLFLARDLSVIPDGEMENDLREIWGSFLVARDLHCGLSKAGAEVYLPHYVAWQFGLIQMVPLFPLSTNRLSANVSQSHGMAGISFQLQKGMTFLTLRPWMRRNAFVEDGRVWYEDFISARFIRPVEEATRGALKKEDWDPLPPKSGKGKKASAVLSRPSAPTAVVSRVTASPTAEVTVVASTATSPSRATTMVGARRTLAHKTVPSLPPARPSPTAGEYWFSRILSSIFLSFVANFVLSLEAPGRKRSREAAITETTAAEAVLVGSAAAEV